MALKLFRSTGFSSPSLFTHTRPQAGVRPWVMLVVSALWLAVPGNLALWQAVLGGTHSVGGAAVGLALAIAIAAFNCALLALLAWRRLLKFAITLLFVLSAAGSWWLLGEAPSLMSQAPALVGQTPGLVQGAAAGTASSWSLLNRLLAIGLIFLLPMLWVWWKPLRIVDMRRQLAGNVIVVGASLTVLAGLLSFAGQDLRALVRHEPGWACLINPAAPIVRSSGHCAPS